MKPMREVWRDPRTAAAVFGVYTVLFFAYAFFFGAH